MKLCDSCLQAGEDEAQGFGLDNDQIVETVLLELGADIADHICDEVETDGEIKCSCACRRR